MKIISNSDFYPSALLQEATSFLSDRQTRVVAVAVAILAFLALAYVMVKYYKETPFNPAGGQAVGRVKPGWIHLFSVSYTLEKDLDIYRTIRKIESAKCFVNTDQGYGITQKEFVLKNLDDPNEAEKQFKKLATYDSHGQCIKGQLMIFFKDENGRFYKHYHHVESTQHHSGAGSESEEEMSRSAFDQSYLDVVNKMGFPKEPQIVNGEFVPGSLYVPL